jgi:hypothetical protein
MVASGPPSRRIRRYRLSNHDQGEIEIIEAQDDEAAEAHARSVSKARKMPVIIDRQTIVDWDYVTEVDERP